MALCNNNKKTEPTPCEQVNPCNLADPCKDVENNSIIIKKYIDECCRTIYPMTGTDAVQLPNGNGNLTDALAALENRIDNLIYSIRSCEGKNSNIDLQITNLTRELASLQGSVTILLNGGSTEIENRIRDIEILINKINELLNLLLESLGVVECEPEFMATLELYELSLMTGKVNTVLPYQRCDLKIYKVKPGSALTIKCVKDGKLSGHRTLTAAGFFNTSTIAQDTEFQPINIDRTVDLGSDDDWNAEKTVTVPEGYNYLALTQSDVHNSASDITFTTEVIDSVCPDNDDDDSGSGSGGGSGETNKIEDVLDPKNDSLLNVDTKKAKIPDVLNADGTSTYDKTNKVFLLPPNILPVHGFLNTGEKYVKQYHSGYYLNIGTDDQIPETAMPLDSVISNKYNYSVFNGEFKKHIIYPIVLPDKTYNNCCLYPANYTANEYNYAIVNIENTNDFAWDNVNFGSGNESNSATKNVGLVSKHFEPNSKGGRSLTTANHIVNIYQVAEGCTYKVNRTDNEGDSALYSIFGDSFDADLSEPIAYAVDSRRNYGISEFEVTIPTNGKYLAICCHGQGNIAVYNISTPDQMVSSSSVTPRTEIIVSPEQSMTMSITTEGGSESEDIKTEISSISNQDNAILVSTVSFDSGTYTFSITNNGLTPIVIDFDDVFAAMEAELGNSFTLDDITIVGAIDVEPSEQIEPELPMDGPLHAPLSDEVEEPEEESEGGGSTTTIKNLYAVKLKYHTEDDSWENIDTIKIPDFCMFYELDSRRFMYLIPKGDGRHELRTC